MVLCWVLLGAILGPVVVAVVLGAAWGLAHLDLGGAIGGAVLTATTTVFIAVMLSPLYLVLGLAWAMVAPRLSFLERSRSRFVAAALVLAIPAAVIVGFDNRGSDPMFHAAYGLVMTWAGLVIPRLLVGALRLGVFAEP
ncbi:MAG TPA: hypothetical protein VHB25_11865 [Gemmatimonadaceae bacterium]|nr:hypothetical protein [Gemmatimonadaceae bacterium]